MKLSLEQLQQFERDGYLFFPAEMQSMLDAVPELYSRREPYNDHQLSA